MKEKIHILMTGAGAPGAAGIIKCLSVADKICLFLVDKNPEAYSRYLPNPNISGFEKVPSGNEPEYANELLRLCKKYEIDIVFPLVTNELIALSESLNLFHENGIKIPITPLPSLEIAINKSRLYQFLEWRGIPVPAFRVVENAEQFKTAVAELGYPEKPVCFKPSVSNGSRGFRILDAGKDERELLWKEKPYSAYIQPAEAERLLTGYPIPELLVSEYLPGDEFSVDCLANQGQAILIVPRIRRKMVNGISVMGELIHQKDIMEYCRSIVRELRLHGCIGFQLKQSARGDYLLVEINPRVQGSVSVLLGAGINLPWLAVKQELNMPVRTEELQVKWGVKFYRYWEDVFY
ncbi:MAG: ATP-grasp domain-containing protein [Chitinophagaceae bacterium]|nr:ATP-grasp domain-containing protein [Chitinophagaceae bacterium]